MKAILGDVVSEYNDRVERLETTEKELNELVEKQDQRNKNLNDLKDEIENLNNEINKNKSRKEILVDVVENKSNYNNGIKTVLSLSKNNKNIIGILGDLINAKEGYELAVSSSLAGAIEFIVTEDDLTARETIKFLRANKAGRATFLPINTMKSRSVRQEHLIVSKTMEGYLGVASDFVEFDEKIANVVLNQLGNIIVAKDIDCANEISKATFERYKVVSLDGDIVNVGGSLTGGSFNRHKSSLLQKKELEEVTALLEKQEKEYVNKRNQHSALDNEIKEVSHTLLQKQMAYAKLEVVVQAKREELIKAKSEYEALADQSVELEDFASGKTENKLIDGKRYLILDDLQDPGNIGTLIRTALAFSIDQVILSNNCVDLYNDKLLRSMQGANFHINCIYDDLKTVISTLKKNNVKIIGSALENGQDIKQIKISEKMAFIVGNEGNGMNKDILQECDYVGYIPINTIESLNVAIAGSIMMYHFK